MEYAGKFVYLHFSLFPFVFFSFYHSNQLARLAMEFVDEIVAEFDAKKSKFVSKVDVIFVK